MNETTARPFMASVNLMPHAPVGRIVEIAKEAERLGYGRCWVYDEGLAARDVYVTLTAIALATKSIAVGPGITNPHTRHPGTTAAAIATLDELSEGRAFLGLGAGGALTLGPLGIDRDKPLTAVREMVTACRSLFSGERVDVEGDTVRFVSARLGYGRPDIEIWLAGRGPRMMRAAGEIADGFTLSYVYKEMLGELISSVRSASVRSTSGRTRRIRICYSTNIASSDADLRAARRNMSFRLLDQPAAVRERIGFSDEDATSIRAALNEGGPSLAASLMRDEWVLPFIVAGSPGECSAELRELMSVHEIDEFQLPIQEIDEAEQIMATLAQYLTKGSDPF